MRGPSESRTTFGCRSSAARSSSANPPSGPINTASGDGGTTLSGAPLPGDRCAPFAVATIEHEDPFACLQAQHCPKIVRLRALDRDGCAGLKRRLDVESRAAEVVSGHRGKTRSLQ